MQFYLKIESVSQTIVFKKKKKKVIIARLRNPKGNKYTHASSINLHFRFYKLNSLPFAHKIKLNIKNNTILI